MKAFISSVISGFEEYRAAACAAIESLGYEIIRAEDFPASPSSPQVTCLAGVRAADLVVMVLGSKYGASQPSGKSATHEEFQEAAATKPLFVFVQSGVSRDSQQSQFVAEAQAWATGAYTASFSSPENLRVVITRALHQWAISSASGQIDPTDLEARALAGLPTERRRGGMELALGVSIASGPRQSIIRPSELEAPSFGRTLMQRALFGQPSIFAASVGTQMELDSHALVLSQDEGTIRVYEDGSLQFLTPLPRAHGLPVIIEEDLREAIDHILEFAAQTLDSIDRTERLSHVAPAVTLINAGYSGWRTRREHERNPNSMTLSHGFGETSAKITLSPPHFSRPAFRQRRSSIADDFMVLLRRRYISQ